MTTAMIRNSLIWCFVNAVCASAICAPYQINTITLSGNQAPGTPNGQVFSSFHIPTINDKGQTAFTAFLSGAGANTTNNSGIWSQGGGNLALVARKGSAAPGTNAGTTLASFNTPTINAVGQTAFRASLAGANVTSTNNVGIWSGGSSLGLVAREGQAAPGGLAGQVFRGLNGLVFNDQGQAAFRADLSGAGINPTNDSGIWSQGNGTLSMVAREGAAAPGTGSGRVFSKLGISVLNDAGQIALQSTLTGGGINSTNDTGIWRDAGVGLAMVAREGDVAPGAGGGRFGNLVAPVINNAGQIAFTGSLTGSGTNDTNNSGVWSDTGVLKLVAREGSQAPGTSNGQKFSAIAPPVINSDGQIAFRALLTGANVNFNNDFGIWSEGGGDLALVAREGNPAPGADSGQRFGVLRSPVFNGNGHTAFLSSISGVNINSTNDAGIWSNAMGQLSLVIREGDTLEVSSGDFRTVKDFALFSEGGNEDGRVNSFNEKGTLAFVASFTDDSSGIFTASILADPVLSASANVLDFGSVIVGATVLSKTFDITETSGNGEANYYVSTALPFSVSGAGNNLVATDSSVTHAVSLDTSDIGTHNGRIGATSGDTDPDFNASIDVKAIVLDHSHASFNSNALDTTPLEIDLGIHHQGSLAEILQVDIFNFAQVAQTADMQFIGLMPVSGDVSLFEILAGEGLELGDLIAAGDAAHFLIQIGDDRVKGEFGAQYQLNFQDVDLLGQGDVQSLTLVLRTRIVPEPTSVAIWLVFLLTGAGWLIVSHPARPITTAWASLGYEEPTRHQPRYNTSRANQVV